MSCLSTWSLYFVLANISKEKKTCSSSYLPPSSLVSRHPMRWMSCWETNSLVMTSSSWLKSALCSSDSTGTAFRYLQPSESRVRDNNSSQSRSDNAATHSVTAKTKFRLSSDSRITVVELSINSTITLNETLHLIPLAPEVPTSHGSKHTKPYQLATEGFIQTCCNLLKQINKCLS